MVTYKEGEVIFKENDLGTEMYIIQTGSVAVDKDIKGQKRRLAVFGKGDFFGEMALLESLPRTATVTAIEDCEVVCIDSATFDTMIRSNIEIAVRMLRKFSVRVRESDRKIEMLLGEKGVEKDDLVFEASDSYANLKPPDGPVIAFLCDEESDKKFEIRSNETLVGRADPVTGIIPDADLTHAENGRSVSRRHVRIILKGEGFHVAEEVGALNGSYINGKKLRPGVLVPLSDGDHLLLGMVALRFELPEK